MAHVRSFQSINRQESMPTQSVQAQGNAHYAHATNFQQRYAVPTQSRWTPYTNPKSNY